MKQYAVYFSDYGVMDDMSQEDQRCRRDFETLDEACKFAVAINKKARYFDIEVVDLFEEDFTLLGEDIKNSSDALYIYTMELEEGEEL